MSGCSPGSRSGAETLRARGGQPGAVYAGPMFWFILFVIVVGGFLAWRFRVKLLAKILGQSESRVNRQLNRRK